MYWIIEDLNMKNNNIVDIHNDNKYIFYQIMINSQDKINFRDDAIYNLSLDLRMEDLMSKRKEELIKIKCNIKVKDSVIQYNYLIGDKEYYRTFLFNDEFTKEDNPKNCIKLPNIKYYYHKTDNYKMPNILTKDYDYVYDNVEFEILPYSKKTLLIKQNGNNKKHTIITNDFKEVKSILQKYSMLD